MLDSYEAVGGFMTGEIDEATLAGIERACLPTIGACAGQFTANTMAMVSEAMGLTIPNVSMVPGVYAERAQIARRAGRLVMEMHQRGGPLPRELVTRKALENGAAIVAATGGSTNAALHLPAIANEAGIAFTLDDVGEVFARTPLIGNLRPGGKYTAKDVHDIGGTAVVIRALIESGHIDGGCLDHHGQDDRGGIRSGEQDRRRGDLSHERADHAGRRRGRVERQSLPGWRRHQNRRPEEDWCSKAMRVFSKMKRRASRPFGSATTAKATS